MDIQNEFINILRNNPNLILEKSDELKCLICKKLMIRPSHSICNCEYCYECISDYIRAGNDKCPGSSEECLNSITVDDIELNTFVKNKISKLKVKCPNKKCDEKNKMSKIIQHVSICDKLGIRCPLFLYGCHMEVEDEIELKNHMIDQEEGHLSKLISLIEELKNRVNENEIEKSDFINVIKEKIENYEIKIVEQDKIMGVMKPIEEKLEIKFNEKLEIYKLKIMDEMKKKIEDEFQMKFTENVKNYKLIIEKQDRIIKEINEKIKLISDKQYTNLAEITKEIKIQVANRKEKNIFDRAIGNCSKQLGDQEDILKKDIKENNIIFDSAIGNCSKQLGDQEDVLKKDIKENNIIFDKAIGNCSKQLGDQEDILKKDIEIKKIIHENEEKIEKIPNEVELKLEVCPFSWIIENWKFTFSNRLQMDKIFGPVFYSMLGEYKFRVGLRFYSNYINFFGQILQCDHDEALEWPCDKAIQLVIINQSTGDYYKFINIDFTNTDENNKPITGENAPLSGDYSLSFDDMNKIPALIKNDKIVIRIYSY